MNLPVRPQADPPSKVHEPVPPAEIKPTPAPVVNDAAIRPPSDGSLGVIGIIYYLFVGLVILAVPTGLFVLCGGRELMRKWFKEERDRKRDGYQHVDTEDLEK
jgi:hypothetical protein